MRGWLIVFLLCVPAVASAQGLFLQKGTSGYGADLAVASDGKFSTVGVDVGGSYKGWLDASIGFSRLFFDPDNFGGDRVTADAVSLGLGVHPLKQSATMPVSLAIGLSGSAYHFNGVDMKASGSTLSSTLYRFFKLSDRFGVIPGVQLTYSYLKIDGMESDDYSVALGGHFAWRLDGDYILTLTPGVEFSDGSTTGLLTLGAVRALP